MKNKELQERTKQFALRVIKLVSSLPKSKTTDVIGYQLLKSGTSIGANYREAVRAESKADFIHKIGIVEKEASETQYWLELITELNLIKKERILQLADECEQLLAIFSASGRTAKRRK
jgi:four helix bundle protein